MVSDVFCGLTPSEFRNPMAMSSADLSTPSLASQGPDRLAELHTSLIPPSFQSLPRHHFRDSFEAFIAEMV